MSENTATAEKDAAQKVHDEYGRDGLVYGCGTALRGKSFATPADREAGIVTRTRWIVLLYLPLIPLASYRVRSLKTVVSGRGRLTRRFLMEGRVPLAWRQVVRVWTVSALTAVIVILLVRMWFEAS